MHPSLPSFTVTFLSFTDLKYSSQTSSRAGVGMPTLLLGQKSFHKSTFWGILTNVFVLLSSLAHEYCLWLDCLTFADGWVFLASWFASSMTEGSSSSESSNWNLLSGLIVNFGNISLLLLVSKLEEAGWFEACSLLPAFLWLADRLVKTPDARNGNFELLHTEWYCVDGCSSAKKKILDLGQTLI